MKKWNKILVSAMAVMMLTAQPAWANTDVVLAGPGEAAVQEVSTSPVIVAGESQIEEKVVGPAADLQQNTETEAVENGSSEVIMAENDGEESSSAEAAGVETAAEEAQPAGRVIDPSRPMVALTYDDGPQPSVGNRIMDCLAQYDGKATFFMVGDRVPRFAAEVQRMAAEGHEVANHTQNHLYLQKQNAETIQAQVAQCNAAIQAACGVAPTLMRLPGGNHNATVRANTNMPMIQWNIDTLDWKTRNADSTVNTILSQVKDGDIILMHELYSQTADATERIVPELVNRGFQLVTVSEMAAAKGRELQAGQIYSAFH